MIFRITNVFYLNVAMEDHFILELIVQLPINFMQSILLFSININWKWVQSVYQQLKLERKSFSPPLIWYLLALYANPCNRLRPHLINQFKVLEPLLVVQHLSLPYRSVKEYGLYTDTGRVLESANSTRHLNHWIRGRQIYHGEALSSLTRLS